MKTQTPMKDRFTIDKEIENVLAQMESMPADTEEYGIAAANLKLLCEARGVKSNRQISSDTIVTAATNILGILLILNFERLGVITSKAIGFTFKGRG